MSTDQKRITPEEVVEALVSRGMKATANTCYGDAKCGCPTLALFLAANGPPTEPLDEIDVELRVLTWGWGLYGTRYFDGFVGAMDLNNASSESMTPEDRAQFDIGYADGRAAWSAVVAAGLVEQA